MATMTRRCCDLCGSVVAQTAPMGKLVVPTARTQATQPYDAIDAQRHLLISSLFVTTQADTETQSYDVCLTCCDGLLRLAAAHKQALRTRLEQEHA